MKSCDCLLGLWMFTYFPSTLPTSFISCCIADFCHIERERSTTSCSGPTSSQQPSGPSFFGQSSYHTFCFQKSGYIKQTLFFESFPRCFSSFFPLKRFFRHHFHMHLLFIFSFVIFVFEPCNRCKSFWFFFASSCFFFFASHFISLFSSHRLCTAFLFCVFRWRIPQSSFLVLLF